MSYLVIDTEGNGLFSYKHPADAEGQPRMASLALIRVSADMVIEDRHKFFVKPDGWTMPQGLNPDGSKTAGMVNGLTDEFLMANGIPVAGVLDEYERGVKEGRIVVAHNVQHDAKQLRGECRRAGRDDMFEQTPNLCTMRMLTDVCKIPPHGRRGGYKWPSLSEACVFFGLTDLGDHTADQDAYACYLLLREMHKRGMDLTGAVHHAKDHDAIKNAVGPAERRPGKSPLSYDKQKRSIVADGKPLGISADDADEF